MYIVVKRFRDLQDDQKHIYAVGDEYPRSGLKPTKKRIAELESDENKLKTPLIKLVGVEEPKDADAGMSRTKKLVRQKPAKVVREDNAS